MCKEGGSRENLFQVMLLHAILLNGFTQIHLCSWTKHTLHILARRPFSGGAMKGSDPRVLRMHRATGQQFHASLPPAAGLDGLGALWGSGPLCRRPPELPISLYRLLDNDHTKIFHQLSRDLARDFIWVALVRKYFSMATRKSSRIAAKGRPVLRKFPGTPENGEASMQCSICLADIKFRGRLSVCKHKFCYACILEWSKVQLMKTFYDMTLMHFRTPTRAHSAREDIGVSRE